MMRTQKVNDIQSSADKKFNATFEHAAHMLVYACQHHRNMAIVLPAVSRGPQNFSFDIHTIAHHRA